MVVIRYICRIGLLFGLLIFILTAGIATIQVEVDGQVLSFSVPAMQMNGRTMVPLRGIFESLGAQVNWDASNRMITATRGGIDVQLSIGNIRATVTGRTVVLDVPAMILHGSTMVPLRFVSEAFGADVKWFEATQTVAITSRQESMSDINPVVIPNNPVVIPNNPVTIPNNPVVAPNYPVITDQWSSLDIRNMVAPIALYPDPLLAILLPASTYLDQVIDADQLNLGNNERAIDRQDWDISVKALAHYPNLLRNLSANPDWTAALGQAYVEQPQDMMDAIQSLREQARVNGVLRSTPEQRVYLDGNYVRIVPAQSNRIYVPEYDPDVVYTRQQRTNDPNLLVFGLGLVIGSWLSNDTDWANHRVYNHGWNGSGWINNSRPQITIDRIYTDNKDRPATVNRNILQRQVDRQKVRNYQLSGITRDQQTIPRPDFNPAPDQNYPVITDQWSSLDIRNMVAPIALYPDPLLAILLPASTYLDQVIDADQLNLGNNERAIDRQDWDISVKALAHYPNLLRNLSANPDWTAALGQAYVEQPQDVMDAIQSLREQARANGVLRSTREQRVYLDGNYVRIVPAQSNRIYVPEYDPDVVYTRQQRTNDPNLLVFGLGLVIGSWLSNDTDWANHRVYNHGWNGSGWINNSRPQITIDRIYTDNKDRSATVNRNILQRQVDRQKVRNYQLSGTARDQQTIPRPDFNPAPDQNYPVITDQWSSLDIRNMVAPIALYPDPLLAILLPASTYLDQVIDADQQNLGNNERAIDRQDWDISVKALAHYPNLLRNLSANPDWTAALGQAYVEQPQDVMDAIQSLREQARANGVLRSTREQRVYLDGNYVRIVPEQSNRIYVPEYDPDVVYTRQQRTNAPNLLVFGLGLVIGSWLSNDTDWANHRVYNHGWSGSGWINNLRPQITIDRIYTDNKDRPAIVNRNIMQRQVDRRKVRNYNLPVTSPPKIKAPSNRQGPGAMDQQVIPRTATKPGVNPGNKPKDQPGTTTQQRVITPTNRIPPIVSKLSPQRPDISLRTSTVTIYAGMGIYNLNGTGQTVSQAVAANVKASYYVHVQNNGDTQDTLKITGTAAPAGWTVEYEDYSTGADITNKVTGTGWSTPVMQPATVVTVAVYVTPGPTIIGGKVATQMVTITSVGDSRKQDVGVLKTMVPVLNRPDLSLRPSGVPTYSGIGVYNLTGANQTVSQAVSKNEKASYYIHIQNNGDIPTTFLVTGTSALAGWMVEYKDYTTGKDITTEVTGAGWTTPVVNVDAVVTVAVYVTPGSTVNEGATATQTVTVSSRVAATKGDVGVMKTTLSR